MVIMYRVSPLTFAVARLLVRVEHIGMPNIILGRRVFPELIQGDVTLREAGGGGRDVTARRDELAAALASCAASWASPAPPQRAARLALELIA